MDVINSLMVGSLICIWTLVLINVVLIVAGYIYYIKTEKAKVPEVKDKYPYVSILVPAHNEGIVIVKTLEALLRFNYPEDCYEIIIINDNSSDNSQELLEGVKERHAHRNIQLIHTDKVTGGKGKSNALNIGFKASRGELIVVYDADNTPEVQALRYLVGEISSNQRFGAVIGKFRTRNKEVNLLTRFINIETLSFQWMAQAGRWQLFRVATIPGTNFIVRRSIIETIGGWDEKAIAEDTEISFRIYKMGYLIKFLPSAVTWEQEPQTLRVWFRQRSRWAKGNIYVLIKNIDYLFDPSPHTWAIKLDLLYFLSVYFLLLTSLTISDVILILRVVGVIDHNLQSFSYLLWLMAFVLFVLGTFVTISTEKGELTLLNLVLIILMYFTYVKLWMLVGIYAMFQYVKDLLLKKEAKWYKTERFS